MFHGVAGFPDISQGSVATRRPMTCGSIFSYWFIRNLL